MRTLPGDFGGALVKIVRARGAGAALLPLDAHKVVHDRRDVLSTDRCLVNIAHLGNLHLPLFDVAYAPTLCSFPDIGLLVRFLFRENCA